MVPESMIPEEHRNSFLANGPTHCSDIYVGGDWSADRDPARARDKVRIVRSDSIRRAKDVFVYEETELQWKIEEVFLALFLLRY